MDFPGGAAAKRLVLESLGWLLVVAGIAALILPGPGLLMLFGGMLLLAQQYEWAERRLEPIRLRALKGAAESVETWPRILLSVLAAIWVIGCGIVWTIRPAAPDWWPAAERWWLFGGAGTGITLIASGVLALVLIAYSYRRFRGKPDAVEELEHELEEAVEELEEERERRHAEHQPEHLHGRKRRGDD